MRAAAIKKEKYGLITELNPFSITTESYRKLSTNIQLSIMCDTSKVFLFTAIDQDDGKSFTVSNLGVVLAQEGKKVLLVDADLRKPSLHKNFATGSIGLADVLNRGREALNNIPESHIPNLFVLPAGSISTSPSELKISIQMKEVLKRLKEIYDVILINSAPILAVADTQLLSTFCDGVVLILSQGKVKREVARQAISRLNYSKANILGVVLINASSKNAGTSYYS